MTYASHEINRPYDMPDGVEKVRGLDGLDRWRIKRQPRHEEFHVTVAGDPFQWRGFCTAIGIKPLWIELNNLDLQLMCAANEDPTSVIEAAGWQILRNKHEVETHPLDITSMQDEHTRWLPEVVEGALYYECHVKLDGPFNPHFMGSSRDLFRVNRWYVTKRETRPFDPQPFVNTIRRMAGLVRLPSVSAEFEYEAAIRDSNPDIDKGWL